ncbi:hypothetical protein BJG92_03183 [Arthrobacter sp. SO5]|uniref:phosphotransferase n=1 Tax=Arthrobacter sp. SO5 TaxID=1897055 RepID=UPI001E534D69|nr:phosphotransferase [Arthrobacter sp. SO5]MCB5275632.1 hypothetical protein [Arthrobacter sp. SO5]
MSWHPPVPAVIRDSKDRPWQVIRAWPQATAGDYVMEVSTPDRPGVRAARMQAGKSHVLPAGRDGGLPDLLELAPLGEVIVHRAWKRAVVRSGDRYFKVFRRNYAAEAADRHTRMSLLLDGEDFLTPDVLSCTPGCVTLSGLAGRSLFELGQDPGVDAAVFEGAWLQWSQGWVRQQGLARSRALRPAAEALPPRPAAVELENLQRLTGLWLVHAGNIPEAEPHRRAVLAAAADVSDRLLRSEPDPLVWSHGDLHDKQILVQAPGAPLGLLDFDEAGRAEAAADLANLAVHLQLRLRQQRLTAERYQYARRQVIAAAEELRVTPARFDAYAKATRLRLGCLYAFRPRWTALAEDLLTGAANEDGLRSTAGASMTGA